jgi:L-lactate dehydrogenase complex protein LldG
MSIDARETILGRLREAVARNRTSGSAPAYPGSFEGYRAQPPPGDAALVARFRDELQALSGRCYEATDAADAARLTLGILQECRARRVLAWDSASLECPGLAETIEAAGIIFETPTLSAEADARLTELAALDPVVAGLTGARGAVAETGTLVLATGPGRSRLASLLPPVHIALVSRRRLYATLPAFLSANPGVVSEGSNLVFVTGPSRTADIEMTLTLGVHGPKEVHVIVMP